MKFPPIRRIILRPIRGRGVVPIGGHAELPVGLAVQACLAQRNRLESRTGDSDIQLGLLAYNASGERGSSLMMLVRPRAWWYNKVPFTFTLILLLIDGQRLTLEEVGVFAAVVLTVCSVGNYGYSVNELFDVEEDARAGRPNFAATAGSLRMWGIVVVSSLCAELLAAVAAGARGALLTIMEICLPAIYSVPPLRIKERKWLGVAADALAAHVYPAILALLAVSHWDFRRVSGPLAVCTVVWSAAVGVRGILSHQLHTAGRDIAAGLETVVHQFGNERLERIIIAAIVPLEVAGFGGMLICCDGGPILGLFVVLYLLYEGFKTTSKRFSVTAFRPLGQRYLPFVEESFYKAWGPLVLALDAARMDIVYLSIIPVYALFFQPHLRAEAQRIRSVLIAPR